MKDAELRLGDPEQVLATSGESFFWARRFLGPTIGHNAARLYSFCRVLDDMADGDIPNGPAHLEVIQSDLERGVWNDHPVLNQFRDLVEDHALPTEVICSLVSNWLLRTGCGVCQGRSGLSRICTVRQCGILV